MPVHRAERRRADLRARRARTRRRPCTRRPPRATASRPFGPLYEISSLPPLPAVRARRDTNQPVRQHGAHDRPVDGRGGVGEERPVVVGAGAGRRGVRRRRARGLAVALGVGVGRGGASVGASVGASLGWARSLAGADGAGARPSAPDRGAGEPVGGVRVGRLAGGDARASARPRARAARAMVSANRAWRMARRVPAISGRARADAASRTSAGSTPNTSRIRSSVRTSAGGPSATSRPRSMTTRRGKKCAARPRSWRTATIAVPSRSLRSRSSSIASTWWRRSRWTVGSSSSSTGAACATARASSTSWRSPSDSSRASRPRGARGRPARSPPRPPPGPTGRAPRSGASCGSRPRRDDLLDPHRERQRRLLRARRRAAGRSAAARARAIGVPPSSTRPAVGSQRAREHAQQRRLAGAVRADERDPLARPRRRARRRAGSRACRPRP